MQRKGQLFTPSHAPTQNAPAADAHAAALAYIFKFVENSRTHSVGFSPHPEQGLERMRTLLARLGNPHTQYPIVHIAGTKGKGSVASLTAAALQAAGYRVGLNTSPHLQHFEERIQVNSRPIAPEALVTLVEDIRPHADTLAGLTTFELITALALWHFARQQVDFVVLETGMGGRLDATNVVTPIISVITSISYDHTEFLGNTLEAIAGEKAGIIKPEIPVVISPQVEEARRTLTQFAYRQGAPLIEANVAYKSILVQHSLEGQEFWVWPAHEQAQMDAFLEGRNSGIWKPTRLRIPLLGRHQLENATTAYAALKTLETAGYPVTEAHIRAGFAAVAWPTRFEVLSKEPPVVLDGAHNRDSARRLREALDDYFPNQPALVIFGASAGKDNAGMLAELKPRTAEIILTRSIHPRAMQPEQLAPLAEEAGLPYTIQETVEEALSYALSKRQPGQLILATGSMFVAAGVRLIWGKLIYL